LEKVEWFNDARLKYYKDLFAMKKIFYIVLDGLGDLPIKELGDKTPLEAADTPNLDNLAKKAKTGVVYPVKKGIAPESDVAVISLLGYDAHKYYTGRGPLESYAEGLKISSGDLALRVNFATASDDGKTIIDRRVGRNLTTQEATALAGEINTKVRLSSATFEFKNTIGHRGVLVIRKNGQLSGWITNTDPAYAREGVFGVALEKFPNTILESAPVSGYEKDPKAQEAARLLNEFTERSHEVLEVAEVNKKRAKEGKMPGNVIVSRDAGDCLPRFPSINELHGLRFGSFVQMPVEKGIALLTGIDVVDIPQSTGKPQVDYPLWADTALKRIKDFDGLYIHIKGPDEPAHDGNFNKKKASIEAIDKFFFANLLAKINLKDVVIAVTADHSTPCRLKAHSADPVPFLVAGGKIVYDGTQDFGEAACRKGSLGEILGIDIMSKLIDFAKM
jgi:2,3-bisphosphoglycerate-independent phosphoglycerate mutase